MTLCRTCRILLTRSSAIKARIVLGTFFIMAHRSKSRCTWPRSVLGIGELELRDSRSSVTIGLATLPVYKNLLKLSGHTLRIALDLIGIDSGLPLQFPMFNRELALTMLQWLLTWKNPRVAWVLG